MGNAGILQEDRRDPSYGARQLRLNRLFTIVAVLSLALGIGGLPVHQPERPVMIWPTGPTLGNVDGQRATSYPMYQDFQRRAEAFSYVFCRYDRQLAMSSGRSTDRVNGELVSGNYFQALGAGAGLGPVFSPGADDRIYKGHPVVVVFRLKKPDGKPMILVRPAEISILDPTTPSPEQ